MQDNDMARVYAKRASQAIRNPTTVLLLRSGQEALRDGEARQSRDRVNPQLAHEGVAVCFHGPDADAELRRRFTIGQPPRDPDQDLTLPGCELAEVGLGLRGRRPVPQRRSEMASDRRREVGVACM